MKKHGKTTVWGSDVSIIELSQFPQHTEQLKICLWKESKSLKKCCSGSFLYVNCLLMKKLGPALLVIFSFSSVSSFTAPLPQYYCQAPARLLSLPRYSLSEQKALIATQTPIDQIVVSKELKQLFLLKNNQVLKSYPVAFGLNPKGPKQFEGDTKTPEGLYYIEYKNPRSAYYLGLKISYPNPEDVRRAASVGRSAGSDIMVHGWPVDPKERAAMVKLHPQIDWTQGCIAVTDQEIFEIYKLVSVGTPIEICPSMTR